MNNSPDADFAIFTEALRLPPEERDRYLDGACKADVEFRRRVEALLLTYEYAGDFLERPAAERPIKAPQVLATIEKAGDRIGHYKLLEQIGEGGCGVVYMAEQEEPVRRRVALKIIKPGMDTKGVIARFEAERQALALMDHPNIAKVFDAGATEAGRPYFVMELVRGVKITEYCNQNSLTTEDRLKLFVQVCQAVQHAHQKGIIHRDIKPSNILVTQSQEGVATPMVIDFGVAKATTNQRLTDKTVFTGFQMLIGTPAYMSPEQATLSSVDVDTRTDIYSLGVLLYELLTSSTPFETEELLKAGLDEIRRVIREQEPLRPSTRLGKMAEADLTTVAQQRQSEPPRLIHKIRGDLDWIAMKALEKDRTRRYETANGLALDVKRFLENEPVSARHPSRLYKFQKAVQRNKLLFIGIGVIAALLVVSLIVVSASLAHERQSQHEARQSQHEEKLVKQFLEEMLQGLDPNFVKGRDTAILREILDKAAARVAKLTNEPGVEGELRNVIGTVYRITGQYSQAEEMQRAALEICRKRFGRESLETAASLNELGVALIANGKMLEAEKVNREALAIRRRRFGDENPDVATSKDNLAHACNDNGKFTEAESLVREALATRRRLCGNESQEVADSLRNLAMILVNTHKWAEAEATAREVLALRRNLLGPQHPAIASSLYDLAWTLTGNGKQKEAEVLRQEAFALRQKVSDNYPDVANSLYILGERMRVRGNLEDAHAVLSATLSLQRKFLGVDHPDTLYTLTSLGLTYEAQTNWSEAESGLREALALRRQRSGNDDPQTLYALRNLAGALEGQGKWAEAETVHREALVSWRKREENGGSETAYTLHKLGEALDAQRKWAEAETVHREQVASWGKRAGDDAPQTLYALRELGNTLECAGKWAEAETVHREALASWRKRAGNDDPQTLYTLDKLGWTLEGVGKWSEAESVYREALASRRKRSGNEDPQALWECEQMYHALVAQRKYSEAAQLLGEVLTPEFLKKPACSAVLGHRLDLMGRQGRWAEALADATTLMQYQPTEHYWWYNVAALLVMTQNRPDYEQLCHRIPAAFTESANPYIAARIADGCLLLPNSGADLRFVDQLATKAVTLGSEDGDVGYFQAIKAFSEYRAGRFRLAVEWAEKALESPKVFAQAKGCAVLAMAEWRLGLEDPARATLRQGNRLAPAISSAHADTVDLGDEWVPWLAARILLDGATELVTAGSTSAKNSTTQ